MSSITTRINDSLLSLYNIDDIIYQALICDYTGSIPDTISKPTDIDIGAMASMIEYMRLLSNSLLKQMYLDQATGDFLEYFLTDYLQTPRLDGETEQSWIERAQGLLFRPKVSRAALISVLRPYSMTEPEIVNEEDNAMFADCSFASRYSASVKMVNGEEFHVYPAVAESFNDVLFSIIIKLTKTAPEDYASVADLLSKSIASGIYYTIQIIE